MTRSTWTLGLVLILLAALTAVPAVASKTQPAPGTSAGLDADLLAGMTARAIGPAAMSGRIGSIDALANDPNVIYVGAATGGLWRTRNGGVTWEPIFDDQPVAAIGAVTLEQANPDVVWVGTGEGNTRNSVSVGNGVYKSLDGGDTWTHQGLDQTERIHRIRLHPDNADIAYVCALGQLWGENEQRGVFKTTNGGTTWAKILYVDERTGCSDLEVDPVNGDKVIVGMWQHRRWPWSFKSGGPGSGLYVTHDGGATWTQRTQDDGLPEGHLGRIGLAISHSQPNVVYAIVEAEKSALLRSDDGGKTFRAVNTNNNVISRPFYYADIRVDPKNPNRVYNLWSLLSASDDGGRTFDIIGSWNTIHPDHHELWIHPHNPRLLINGNDGGVTISQDHGRTWRFIGNLPLAQFYHVRADNQIPYNVYGGLQDNGSWVGPNEVWENGGIRNHHWQEVNFGDGFDTVPDPQIPNQGYAMAQTGYLVRWNLDTGEQKEIRPAPPAEDEKLLRFNWNAGIEFDPHDPTGATVYYGSQYIHKSTDRGDTWTIISPDLTTNNPEWQKQAESGGLTLDVTGAENFTSILAIDPSPVQEGVIWAATDDGRLHVTQDGGETWTSVEGNLPGVPANTWIPHVNASPHAAGTAFVVLDDHRRSNWTPYVLRTDDFGQTWTSLVSDNLWGYALVIEQDPVDPNLLFLGTEFGLWISTDAGSGWLRFEHGVPTVSVMDLAIQETEHDLVIGTHGRGLFVLDDIRPLRGLAAEHQAGELRLFEIPTAYQHEVAQTGSSRFPGNIEFRGENPRYGALLTFSLHGDDLPHPDEAKERERKAAERAAKLTEVEAGESTEQEPARRRGRRAGAGGPGPGGPPWARGDDGPQIDIEVADASGEVIRRFKAPARQGLNRTTWNLARDGFRRPAGDLPFWITGAPTGPAVPPGTYTVTVKFRDQESSQTVEVKADPRIDPPQSQATWEAHYQGLLDVGALQEVLTDAVERIDATKTSVDSLLARAGTLNKEALEAEEEEGGEIEDAASETADSDTGDTEGEAGNTSGTEVAATEEDEAARGPYGELLKAGRELNEQLDGLRERLVGPEESKGIQEDTDAQSYLGGVRGSMSSSWDPPTAAQLAYLERVRQQLAAILEDLNRVHAEDVAAFRTQVRESQLDWLPEQEPLTLPESE